MKALELVAHDAARGLLNEQRLARIKAAIIELATDLEKYDRNWSNDDGERRKAGFAAMAETVAPPDEQGLTSATTSSRSATRICVVAAHSQLDEIAATILAQLLRKQGLRAETAPRNTVSREAIVSFDRDVSIFCMCYIDDLGRVSRLRFLLRRLRQKLSSASLLAITWPSDHPLLRDHAIRTVRRQMI